DLDVTGAGQRAGQVRDLALHAVRERGARADDERRTPGVGAEGVAQLLAGEGLVGAGPAVLPVERVGDVQPERVRRGVAGAEPGAKPERVVAGPLLTQPELGGQVTEQRGRGYHLAATGLPHRLHQLGLPDRAGVVEVQRVAAGLVALRQ